MKVHYTSDKPAENLSGNSLIKLRTPKLKPRSTPYRDIDRNVSVSQSPDQVTFRCDKDQQDTCRFLSNARNLNLIGRNLNGLNLIGSLFKMMSQSGPASARRWYFVLSLIFAVVLFFTNGPCSRE